MIRVTDISYSYGLQPLYEKSNFTIGENVIVGLVGPNGAGKSTLFKLLAGYDSPNTGTIEINGTVGYVPQEIKRDETMEQSRTIQEYIDPEHKKPDHELKRILSGLELENLQLADSPQHLSGGQKTKLAIARALIQEPDILLLDEPTNFLDVQGKQWVMKFLSTYPNTVLLISHDLKLLDKHISKVLAINWQSRTIDEYQGNYSSYVRQKKERDEILKRHIESERKHLKRMKEGLIKMARFTSDKGVRQRMNLKRRIQRIEDKLPEAPKELRQIKVKLIEPIRCGELPIMVRNLCKSYGDVEVLKNVSFSLRRGEKMALLGPNGVGKSTLIKTIVGMHEPDSGEIIRDQNLKIGYYSQEFETFDMDMPMIDFVNKQTQLSDHIIRPMLARFLFTGQKVFQKIGTLSGGEKTRLSIALILLHPYNLLVLDEPTTYLDVLSQRIILESLKQYTGTIIIVSHTEEFITELNPNKALILPDTRLQDWSPELIEKIGEV